MIDVGINAAPLAAARTGVGRYIAGLLDALAAHAQDGINPRPLFLPGAPARGLRPLVKRLPFAYFLAETARAAALERERRRGLTVYHETNHAAPRFRGPVVLTVHDLSTVLHPETQERARARHFANALRKRARLATRVIVPTQAIAREVCEHLDVKPERVRAIHHGVGSHFSPGPQKRLNFVLFSGGRDPRKGLDTLLAAMPPGADLVQVGPGSPLGFVADDELVDLYRTCALFVLPSLYEGFGFPLIEAMACGAPCIASDDPALVEVSGGAALHFPRGDASALRRLIEKVLGDPGDLAQKGIDRARGFRWDECAAKHAEVYREAAA
ncbi:MAG: glycosyltransferase family 4 protein [Myxococcales bacterium]|nr:glycosyltransferase family 4 protein [Myxococcales bacterium]